jgi:hypothetical protein
MGPIDFSALDVIVWFAFSSALLLLFLCPYLLLTYTRKYSRTSYLKELIQNAIAKSKLDPTTPAIIKYKSWICDCGWGSDDNNIIFKILVSMSDSYSVTYDSTGDYTFKTISHKIHIFIKDKKIYVYARLV